MAETVAFYAPLKPPDHPVPSGDRRMARALMAALGQSGREVMLASRLRSFDRDGDAVRQERIRRLGVRAADRLITRCRALPSERLPRAWVTYHVYHKSPDWLGPVVSRALGIPYLLIEASFASKQAGGLWDCGYRGAETAIKAADVALAMTAVDEAGLVGLIQPPSSLRRFPPFLDPTPYRDAFAARSRHRKALAVRWGLDERLPWLLAVGMMRDDVKRQSYALLARALSMIGDRPWQLLIVGDGVSRPMIEKDFESFGSQRVKFAGILEECDLAACYAAADVYAWPAVREAYGMAFLEAQASGLPVVAGREGGVADVVRDGVTGILKAPREPEALASAIADLLDHPMKRRKMSVAARALVDGEHSMDRASLRLDRALADASSIRKGKAETGTVAP